MCGRASRTVPSLSLVVALASTFLVLDAAAETCPTRKILRPLKLPVEVPDLRERVLFIGTQFSILYTFMYSPA
jgi:hypothetical protein